ncbi:MAG: hypothetical protein IPP73_10050 [Chitinophagaceae bacterium]|nr:hypothetical protein [Chitinophagaceae bacterium]
MNRPYVIPSNSGVIVLWDEEGRQLTIPAIAGEALFNEERLRTNSGILLKIGLSGQSEIMVIYRVLIEKGIIQTDVHSLIYAMKVKQRILGAIILAGKEAEQYSAAHLEIACHHSITVVHCEGESATLYKEKISGRSVKGRSYSAYT